MPQEPEGRTLGAPPSPTTVDQLRNTAAEQHGLLTRRQCLSAGLSDEAIRWRLERGRWLVVHHGVYLTEPGGHSWHTRALAAQPAVPGSTWSHRTAGHVHGLLRTAPPTIELVVDGSRHVASPNGRSRA